jgi:hypothetical protein
MSSKPSFKQTQVDFAAHIRDPVNTPANKEIEDRRMAIYRDLFINSISSLLAGSFPVIKSLYSETEWKALVRKFYRKEHNKTPHFPEIPREFVDFLKDNPIDLDKPFLYELAHYEWLELHLEKHNAEVAKQNLTDLKALLKGQPVISPLVKLQAYQYPVHQIKASHQPQQPLTTPLFMLLWRDGNYQVNFSELKPFSALLLETLINNQQQSGEQVLLALAAQYQHPKPAEFIQQGLQTLHQWHQQDIIIATQPI